MNKKSVILLIIIILILISVSIFNYYSRPIKVEKSFDSGVLVKNNIILNDSIKINLEGTVFKTKFIFQIFKFKKELSGTLVMDNIKYELNAVNIGKGTNNVFWGDLKTIDKSNEIKYVIFINETFSKLYINDDINGYSISAPSNNLEDHKENNKMWNKEEAS